MGDEPNTCPACGYDLTGVAAPACPECGIDVAAERARLAAERDAWGERRTPPPRMAWVLILLLPGALLWTWLAQAPFVMAAQYPYDPFKSPMAWYIWGVLVLQWTALLSCLAFIRKLARRSERTPGVLMALLFVQLILPILIIPLSGLG